MAAPTHEPKRGRDTSGQYQITTDAVCRRCGREHEPSDADVLATYGSDDKRSIARFTFTCPRCHHRALEVEAA